MDDSSLFCCTFLMLFTSSALLYPLSVGEKNPGKTESGPLNYVILNPSSQDWYGAHKDPILLLIVL